MSALDNAFSWCKAVLFLIYNCMIYKNGRCLQGKICVNKEIVWSSDSPKVRVISTGAEGGAERSIKK